MNYKKQLSTLKELNPFFNPNFMNIDLLPTLFHLFNIKQGIRWK